VCTRRSTRRHPGSHHSDGTLDVTNDKRDCGSWRFDFVRHSPPASAAECESRYTRCLQCPCLIVGARRWLSGKPLTGLRHRSCLTSETTWLHSQTLHYQLVTRRTL